MTTPIATLILSNDALISLIGVIVAFLSFLLGLFVYWRKQRDSLAILNREIYQRLELAACDLYRFEIEQAPTTRKLWEKGDLPPVGTFDRIAVSEYLCQILTLFEMAIRFRNDRTMEREVFGSWVLWFHNVCWAENFPPLYQHAKYNYLPTLRRILDEGLRLRTIHSGTKNGETTSTTAFFSYMAAEFDCDIIKTWFPAET